MCGEASEDDRVDGSDAGAGEQGDGEFGTHAHVNGYAVATFYAEAFEYICEALDLLMKFAIGKFSDLAGFAFPEESDFVFACAEGVAVDAVVREVEFASDEPFGVSGFAFGDCGPGGKPVELGGGFGPELVRLLDAAAIEDFVLREALDVGLGRKLCRGREYAVFAQS